MFQGKETAENGRFPNVQPHAVTVLQGKGRFLVGKAELGGLRPVLNDVGGGDARLYRGNGNVQDFPALFIGVNLRLGRAANRQSAVVAGAIAHIAVQDVKINLVAGPQDAVGIDMRMRTGAFPANGIDALHIFRPQLVQHLVDQGHAVIFPHPGPQFQIQGVIGGVHHSAGGIQQGNFVLGFDAAGFQHQLLAVHYIQPLFLQGEQHYRLYHIHAHRFLMQAAQFQFHADFPGYILGQVSRGRRSPAQSGNAGPGAFPQPGAVNLMMPRRRAEIPQNRLVLLGQ